MKFISIGSLFIALCVSSLASADTCNSQSVQKIKSQILAFAKKNTSNIANRPEVRKDLESLLFQLECKSKAVDETTWLQYSPGSWRQVWSDEADNSPAGAPKQDLEKIFQIVTPQGRAVNFGVRVLPNGQRVTFALEAKGTVAENIQATEILNGFVRNDDLKTGEWLQVLANDIFNATYSVFNPIKLGAFPNGPINAKSDLTIRYLDEELKMGTAPNVFTGVSEMFVLERVDTVR